MTVDSSQMHWRGQVYCLTVQSIYSCAMLSDQYFVLLIQKAVMNASWYGANKSFCYHTSLQYDVIKWKQFPRYWPFVWGSHRLPVNFAHKSQWRGALMLSLICAWINGWGNNRKAGDLRRRRAHYDVTVMIHNSKLSYHSFFISFRMHCIIYVHAVSANNEEIYCWYGVLTVYGIPIMQIGRCYLYNWNHAPGWQSLYWTRSRSLPRSYR